MNTNTENKAILDDIIQSEAIENKELRQDYRNHLTTIDKQGKRKWIYPYKPKGTFTKWRNRLSYLYYAIFFAIPFIYINGNPMLMFNVTKGIFVIFGVVFWPQDFFIFGLMMLAGIIFIALFTMAFGRLFCGWMCPQTIFMEFLFRKIEYAIEGDAPQQKQLNAAPWTFSKFAKKATKHSIFLLLSFIIANTFLAYIIGSKELYRIITDNPMNHLGGLTAITIFTLVFYSVFAFVRELVCTNICPYGRLQGVLLDNNSVVVAYDYVRGEPRSKSNAKLVKVGGSDVPAKADCVDCGHCIRVCPTGIDIRNGTQLECVNCTACIDACDNIMAKLNKPTGLIRYDSEFGIAAHKKNTFTPRLKVYSIVLTLILTGIVFLLFTRKDVSGTMLRSAGTMYQEKGTDSLSNLYSIKLVNKTMHDLPLTLKLENVEGTIEYVDHKNYIDVKPESQASANVFIVLPRKEVDNYDMKLKVGFYDSTGRKITTIKTNFLGPLTNFD